jgi:hypothetical protein
MNKRVLATKQRTKLVDITTKLLFGLFAIVLISNPVFPQSERIQKVTNIEFEAISEMSGLAKSRRYADVYWMHNDSGDRARLFAADSEGKVIIPRFMSSFYHGEREEADKNPWPGLIIETAVNIDWEDIAVDEDFLYIADMGNNGNVILATLGAGEMFGEMGVLDQGERNATAKAIGPKSGKVSERG